jgi:tetratricopeptide (TPR) repeat protein
VARKERNPTAETLRELEASSDRFAEWASQHALLILAVVVGILVIAAGGGLWMQHRSSQRDAAADTLALINSDYRLAMGADPAGGAIPEPANPDLALRTRSEYLDRFESVGREYGGTAAGSLAWLEAGNLAAALGRTEEAIGHFEAARASAARHPEIASLAWMRLADLAEARGDWTGAAEAFEAAAAAPTFPLQASALSEAARCWAAAGEPQKALATFQRLESEFPDTSPAPSIAALMQELRLELGHTR